MKITKLILLMSAVALSADCCAKTYTVKNTNDEGKGSFRAAIIKSNACPEHNCIAFNIPTSDQGYNPDTQSWRIQVASELPVITAPVSIDGYTQPGSRPNCNPMNQGHSGKIKIELSGPGCGEPAAAAQGGMRGLAFGQGSDYSCVRGLAIHGFPIGIEVCAKQVKVAGNFLGVGVDGATSCPNVVSIWVKDGASDTAIGSGNPEDRNVIAGTGHVAENPTQPTDILGAITDTGSTNTTVQGSTVNLTSSGTQPVDTTAQAGIVATQSTGTTIGGPSASQAVVVAAFQVANVQLNSPQQTTISNVLSGSGVSGLVPLQAGSAGAATALSTIFAIRPMALMEDEKPNVIIESSMFSGCAHGIVIGHPDDPFPVTGVVLKHVKAGTSCTGEAPLPNTVHGIWLRNSDQVKMDNIRTMNNGCCGLCQEYSVTNTVIQGIDTSYNGEGGIKLVGPETRAVGEFEGRIINSRIKGNGDNAIASPCGYMKSYPSKY